MCPNKLEIIVDPKYKQIRCLVHLHYLKHIEKDYEAEYIYILPYRVVNYVHHFPEFTMLTKNYDVDRIPAHNDIYCEIQLHDDNKFGPNNGGYNKILRLNHHIHVDTEDKLFQRIKNILLLS